MISRYHLNCGIERMKLELMLEFVELIHQCESVIFVFFNEFSLNTEPDKENGPFYVTPLPWSPIDPSSQIGLLANFYRRLQNNPDGMIEVLISYFIFTSANI